MSNSEDEGTPMEGPLPLELQQIRAESQREAALAAAHHQASVQRRRSEDTAAAASGHTGKGSCVIKIRRSSTGDTVQVVQDDIATRRSSRPIKRRKFDDELAEAGLISPVVMTPGPPPPIPDPVRSRNSSSCESPNIGGHISLDPALVNSCQALPDLKLKKKKKKGRRDGTYKDLGRWKATDDLALINAVQQTRDLGAVFKGVKFSCHFTLSEIQERWYALLYDPVISKLAMEAIRNLPPEVVHRVSKSTPFSREEEDAIANCGVKSSTANVDVSHFEKILSSQPTIFHPSRSARSLLIHWQYMKQYSLLPDQTVQPLPRPETAQHILNFHDGEDQVVDSDLQDPPDLRLNNEMMIVDRMAKREIRRLEAEVSKWQIVVEQVTGQPTADFDNQTLAVLRGRLVRYLMRSREISVGRATQDQGHTVDVDLALEGPAGKVSRKQAIIKLTNNGEFHIANEGRRPVMVNGNAVVMGEMAKLANNTVVEFCNLRFVFLINTELIEAIRTEAAKNQFVTRNSSDPS